MINSISSPCAPAGGQGAQAVQGEARARAALGRQVRQRGLAGRARHGGAGAAAARALGASERAERSADAGGRAGVAACTGHRRACTSYRRAGVARWPALVRLVLGAKAALSATAVEPGLHAVSPVLWHAHLRRYAPGCANTEGPSLVSRVMAGGGLSGYELGC